MQYERYLELCQKAGKSPSKAAQEAGLSSAAATGWKQGGRMTDANQTRLVAYFRGLGIDVPDGYFDVSTPAPSSRPKYMRPIVGYIPAGYPCIEESDILGYAPTAEPNPDGTYWLYIHGDSMVDAGIRPNDRVLMRSQTSAEDGQIVACQVDGENTLKRLRRDGKRVYLCPENKFYRPIELTTADFDEGRAMILGVAIEVAHRL